MRLSHCSNSAPALDPTASRLKDMIKTGGENLSPSEVEHVLVTHPVIHLAAVVGVPDDRWGEVVKAFVVPVAGASVDTDELDRSCRARLDSFTSPRQREVIDDLPRTASGEVRPALLRRSGSEQTA